MNALTKKRLTAKLCSMSTIIIVVLVFMVFCHRHSHDRH